MSGSRPFSEILEDISGLCRQLADAHAREVAALELKLAVSPSTPGTVEEQPSTPSAAKVRFVAAVKKTQDATPKSISGFNTLHLTDIDSDCDGRARALNGTVATVVTAPTSGFSKDPSQTPSAVQAGKPKFDFAVIAKTAALTLTDKKEKMFENIRASKDEAEHALTVFKTREVWDLSEQEMVRIKRKVRQDSSIVCKFEARRTTRRTTTTHLDSKWDWFMVHPQSNSRLAWDLAGICWLSYDIIMLPLQVFPLPEAIFFDVMNMLGNIYWTADIPAALLTGTYDKSVPIMNWRPVAHRYLRSWFLFDFFLVFISWLITAMESASGAGAAQMGRTLRFARFLRVLRYLRVARLLRLLKGVKIFNSFGQRANSDFSLFLLSVLKMVAAVTLMSHLLACCWYMLGNVPDGWVRVENTGLFNETGITGWDVGDQYLYTYQWSLSRLHPSTIEKNLLLRTTNERIFAVFGGLFAMVVGAGVISVVTNLLREFQERHKRRKHNLALVQTYVLKYAISVPLAVRAKRYIDFEHEAKLRSEREAELLAVLPHDMVLDFQYEAYSPVMNRHDFFAELHCRDLRTHYDICHRAMSSTIALSGEVVFTAGDACGRMRFVTAGAFSYAFGDMVGTQSETLAGASSRRAQHPDEWEGLDSQRVDVGIGLSEAVLWTAWEHRGELYCPNGGSVLEVVAEHFADVLRKHEQGLVVAAIHARFFVEELNATRVEDLSDLPANARSEIQKNTAPDEKDENSGLFSAISRVTRLSVAAMSSDASRGTRFSVGAMASDGSRGDEEEGDATKRMRRQSLALRKSYPDGFQIEAEDL